MIHDTSSNHEFPALDQVTRTVLTTEQAAFYLNRRPQTLRAWAMKDHPIRAVRVNGRLGWPVDQIKALLNGDSLNTHQI